MVDSSHWPEIRLNRDNIPMSIHKPIASSKIVPAEGTRGNEGIDVGYSVCRIDVTVPEGQSDPEWAVPFKVLKECLQWIRVIGLQYWLGTMPSGSKVIARGSIIAESGSYSNFGGYGGGIAVHPFTKEQWEWVGNQLGQRRLPPIPDLLVSDALISFREGDILQTVIRLGVVCELALNALIEDLLALHPLTVRQLYDERKPFEKKLKEVPAILGAERYQDHNARWAKELCSLYSLRGSAIHRGSCQLDGKDVDQEQVSWFIFATLDFLNWAQDQRMRLNIPT